MKLLNSFDAQQTKVADLSYVLQPTSFCQDQAHHDEEQCWQAQAQAQ